mmetsp:Transcript_6099/g.25904  ORF Transcript_6099/g.25904 Transcript_6099/m.25904 type:complete len:278 (-) Transcript_6099:615-1448(-)
MTYFLQRIDRRTASRSVSPSRTDTHVRTRMCRLAARGRTSPGLPRSVQIAPRSECKAPAAFGGSLGEPVAQGRVRIQKEIRVLLVLLVPLVPRLAAHVVVALVLQVVVETGAEYRRRPPRARARGGVGRSRRGDVFSRDVRALRFREPGVPPASHGDSLAPPRGERASPRHRLVARGAPPPGGDERAVRGGRRAGGRRRLGSLPEKHSRHARGVRSKLAPWTPHASGTSRALPRAFRDDARVSFAAHAAPERAAGCGVVAARFSVYGDFGDGDRDRT